NRGPLEAAREAVAAARGKYVAIHHSDDAWEPDKLEKQVRFLDDHPEYAACFTLVKYLDEESRDYIPPEGSFYSTVFRQPNRTRAEWLRHFFFFGNCLCHPSLLIRRGKYAQYGLLDDPGLWQLPDFCMWVKLALHDPIYILQEPLTKFRLRSRAQLQHSGERPDVSIRSQFELYQVLRLYTGITGREQMMEVFPGTARYLDKEHGDVLFALAKTAQEVGDPPYQLLSMELLYEAIRNPVRSKEIEQRYGYTYRDFIKETGAEDVFRTSSTMGFLLIMVYVDYGDGFELKGKIPEVYITQSGGFHASLVVVDTLREAKSLKILLGGSRYKRIAMERIAVNRQELSFAPDNAVAREDGFDVFMTFAPEYIASCREGGELSLELSGRVDRPCILDPMEALNAEAGKRAEQRRTYEAILTEKEQEIADKSEEIRFLGREIDARDRAIRDRDEEIAARDRNIAGKDEELRAIRSSRGWRLLQWMWAVRDKIVPMGSKRRLFLKLAYKSMRSPGLTLSKLSISNIRKFFYYLKTEDASSVEARVDMHMPSSFGASSSLVLVPAIEETKENLLDYEGIDFPRFDDVEVSIIIPVYNQFDFTYNCLKSIRENTKGIRYEVLIADDCSKDHTHEMEKLFPDLVVIHNEKNLGFLKNCNHAASKARGRYILFLNNDTQVQPDWLPPLVRLLEEHEDIGMTGSKLVYPTGKLQEAGGIYWKDGSAWNYGHAGNPDAPEFNYVKDVDYISGASILIRRTLWEKIGGFDELFVPAYCEDSDLAFAVRAEGYRVVYQPKSVVVHFEGISNGRDVKQGIKKYQVENQKKLYEKWKEVLESEHFPNGEEVFLARDRSRSKKTIVVVDHYVPHYDTDAGGRCTFEYLKLFVELGMHVVFVGDNYAAHQPYTDELRQMGVDVLAGEGWTMKKFREWLENYGKYVDYAYLNRPHISVKYMDLFKEKTHAKIFYFGHDLHFIRERRQAEIENRPELLESAKKWEKIEKELFSKADVVHVVGAYEQEVLQEMFPGKPIRNIPLYLYSEEELRNQAAPSLEGRDTMIFVGGFNHQPNQDAIFWFMEEIYPIIMEEFPELVFYIVGSKPTEKVKALAGKGVIVTGYVSDEKLAEIYGKARVNVIPLRFGAGVKGKVVETMGFGVPAVTTPIGAEGLPGAEECVDVTEDPKDYASRVIRYLKDDAYWLEQSEKEHRYIREHFTISHAREILREDME
ncbi:MAG: glycosyltransferase, partial [Selenomonadaceae bacterium]|nr:glycosyltransferase [Selenomonadaceae bacterium]